MVINNNVAYSYVKAIFALSVEKENINDWEQLLILWSTAIKLSPQFFITTYIIDKKKQLEFLINICTIAHINIFESAINLLKILISKKQLILLPQITTFYQQLSLKHTQTIIVKVICAIELTEAQKLQLKSRLETRFKSKLKLNYYIDSSLIGGIKLYFNDQVIDLSISGQLKRLKETIILKI